MIGKNMWIIRINSQMIIQFQQDKVNGLKKKQKSKKKKMKKLLKKMRKRIVVKR